MYIHMHTLGFESAQQDAVCPPSIVLHSESHLRVGTLSGRLFLGLLHLCQKNTSGWHLCKVGTMKRIKQPKWHTYDSYVWIQVD